MNTDPYTIIISKFEKVFFSKPKHFNVPIKSCNDTPFIAVTVKYIDKLNYYDIYSTFLLARGFLKNNYLTCQLFLWKTVMLIIMV